MFEFLNPEFRRERGLLQGHLSYEQPGLGIKRPSIVEQILKGLGPLSAIFPNRNPAPALNTMPQKPVYYQPEPLQYGNRFENLLDPSFRREHIPAYRLNQEKYRKPPLFSETMEKLNHPGMPIIHRLKRAQYQKFPLTELLPWERDWARLQLEPIVKPKPSPETPRLPDFPLDPPKEVYPSHIFAKVARVADKIAVPILRPWFEKKFNRDYHVDQLKKLSNAEILKKQEDILQESGGASYFKHSNNDPWGVNSVNQPAHWNQFDFGEYGRVSYFGQGQDIEMDIHHVNLDLKDSAFQSRFWGNLQIQQAVAIVNRTGKPFPVYVPTTLFTTSKKSVKMRLLAKLN